ncbi:MAG: amidohydrolase family protein [Candidatus Thorarchaeota archaeon]
MVVNIHSHLAHKNMWSDKFWDFIADSYSFALGIPKEGVYQNLLPLFWASSAENYVKVMDEAGIKKTIVMGVDYGMSEVGEANWSIEEMNQWVAKQADEYSDKLKALCAVDPRRGAKAVELVEKAVKEWGMIGVKFHPTAGYYPDDPQYFPLYEKCVELDVPLHSHTAATISAPMVSKYADPIYLDTIAAKFPRLKIVLVHFGSLSYTLKCAEIMGSRPNVYAELSGYQIQAQAWPEYFLKTLRSVLNMKAILGTPLKERLMFGTDWPYLETALSTKDWVQWIKDIPEKAKQYGITFTQDEINNILSGNAQKLFNL